MPWSCLRAVLLAATLIPLGPAATVAAACRSEPAARAVPLAGVAAVVRLLARHKVKVDEVCRDARGLRFYAAFAADPQSGPNAKFYNSLFLRVVTLLGAPHVTLVDRDDALAIALDRTAADELSLTFAPWHPRS